MLWEEARKRLEASTIPPFLQPPSNFKFMDFGDFVRIYFLGTLNKLPSTLLFKDIPKEKISCQEEIKNCLNENLTKAQTLSKQEELLRERMRVRGTGITNFNFSKHKSSPSLFPSSSSSPPLSSFAQIIFQSGNELNLYRDEGKSSNISTFKMIDNFLQPITCPYDSDVISFVSNGDLYLKLVPDPSSLSSIDQSDNFIRLTHLRNISGDFHSNTKSAGMPSYIVQEEFDRFIGYWWRGCDLEKSTSSSSSSLPPYQILYEEVDESEINILNIPSYHDNGLTVDYYRYPRAGTKNAKSDLKIVTFQKKNNQITDINRLELEKPIFVIFQDMEYLLDAGWLNDYDCVYAVMVNRKQNIRKTILIPINNFNNNNNDNNNNNNNNNNDNNNKYYELIIEKCNDHWLHSNHLLTFLKSELNEKKNIISCIYGNEESGHLHLNKATFDLDQITNNNNNILTVKKLEDKSLTSGDWEVDEKKLWIDENKKLVYFIAYKETPLETHLYRLNYNDNNPNIILLTKPDFSHNIFINIDCNMYLSNYSNSMTPQKTEIFQIFPSSSSSSFSSLSSSPSSISSLDLNNSSPLTSLTPPIHFSFKSTSGHDLYAIALIPNKIDYFGGKSQKLPVLLYVYGGPGVKIVENSFAPNRQLFLHQLCQQGFVVVVCDNRGSCHRGNKFEKDILYNLGEVELKDQVECLEEASRRFSVLDMNRVAIMGWSYGGYMSLKALIQRPDIFKVSISGAPVTTWEFYDTGYTERYMGIPEEKMENYHQSSVLNHAHLFPDQTNRLLLIHGLMDENVHFFHTSSLVHLLNTNLKPYTLQTYPLERHGIRNQKSHEHCQTLIFHFLSNYL